MAFKDGTSNSTWAGFRTSAYGGVADVEIALMEPHHQSKLAGTVATLTIGLSSWAGAAVDVEIQVARDTAFTDIVTVQSITNVTDGIHSRNATGLPVNVALYWRARAAPTGTTSWGPWFGQPQLSNTASTPHNLSAATITASSNYGSGWTPQKAFDGIIGADATGWASVNNGLPGTLQVDAGTGISLSGYRICPRTDYGIAGVPAQSPASWTLQGSNDGTSWTVVDTRSGVTWGNAEPKLFQLNTAVTYRFYKIVVTATVSGTLVAISELELYPTGTPAVVPMQFQMDVNVGRGYGNIAMNTGIDPSLRVSGQANYVDLNVGVQALVSSKGNGYLDLNVGVPIVLDSHGWGYINTSDVSANPPTPHVWFIYRKIGFAGDEVWVYGHGFGNPKTEYSGELKVDPGPDYTTADQIVATLEWYLQENTEHALDDQRTIYVGTEGAAPRVDMQVEIVRFEVPSGLVPEIDPVTHRFYIQTTQGASNKADFLMYPTLPTEIGSGPTRTRGSGHLRLSVIPAEEFGGIEQRLFYADPGEIVVTEGRPARPAMIRTTATLVAQVGEWDVESELAAALAVDLGATRRWLADPSKVVAHPELGTGVSLWVPSAGSTAQSLRIQGATAPYVDPGYSINTRLGERDVPAMIFDGTTFAELTNGIATGPQFTLAMVARLHPGPSGRGTLMSTFRTVPNPAYTDWEIYLESDRVRGATGRTWGDLRLNTGTDRPVILIASIGGTSSQILLVDDAPSEQRSLNASMQGAGNRLYLGKSWRLGSDADFAAMDVLDVAWWDTQLTSAAMWQVANKLDGIYGVTG